MTRLEYQTILAWNLHVNVVKVGYKYGPAIASNRPIVLFTPYPHGGWLVQALHQRVWCRMSLRCRASLSRITATEAAVRGQRSGRSG